MIVIVECMPFQNVNVLLVCALQGGLEEVFLLFCGSVYYLLCVGYQILQL